MKDYIMTKTINKSKDLQQKIKKNTSKIPTKEVTKTNKPVTAKSNKSVALHLVGKNKNILHVVRVPNNTAWDMNEIAETVKQAVDSGGILLLPNNIEIITIHLK